MPTIRLQLGIPGLSSRDALEFLGPTLQVEFGITILAHRLKREA